MSDEDLDARERGARLYPRAPHLVGAYIAGARAAQRGRSAAANPYGAGGWRSAFRNAWRAGWSSVASPPVA